MKFLRIVVMLFILSLPEVSIANTHVLLTIDVESFWNGNPKKDIWGYLNGDENGFGVPLILDILEKNQSEATFYLNVYEIAKHGENGPGSKMPF